MQAHKPQAFPSELLHQLSIFIATLAHSADPYLLISPQGEVISFNHATANLLGYATAEPEDLTLSSLVSPSKLGELERVITFVFDHNEPANFESQTTTKNGLIVLLAWSITPFSLSKGNPQGALVRLQNQTDQQYVLNALLDREFKLSAIVNCSPSALSLKTPEGVYALANPNLQHIHNLAEASIIGKTDFDLYPDDIAKTFRANDALVVRTKSRHSIEELVPVAGQMRTFMSHMFPVLDADGDVNFICRISLDITDKKLAEAEVEHYQQNLEAMVETRTRELDLAKASAESANRAKSTFLSTISHEIRNPLGGIKGIADLLTMHNLQPEIRELVSIQKGAIEQLSGILNDVLDYSKIEAGKLEFDDHPFDLANLIEDMAKLKRIRCKQKGLGFTLSTHYENHTVYMGDPVRVRQVVQNLLSNALKFTKQGSITLAVQANRATDRVDEISIAVSDTGIGIPMQDQQRLFSPFVQASQSEHTKAQGTGLGLSIVKSLVERMNGSVSLTSQLGLGSTFTATLRLPVCDASLYIKQKSQPGMALKQMTILLADDDNISRKVVSNLLRKLGHTVVDVSSAEAALAALGDSTFDILLTDYSMPDMTGTELMLRAKETQAGSNQTKYFCLSGHTQKDFIDELINDGFDAYFPKPLNIEAFGQKLIDISTEGH